MIIIIAIDKFFNVDSEPESLRYENYLFVRLTASVSMLGSIANFILFQIISPQNFYYTLTNSIATFFIGISLLVMRYFIKSDKILEVALNIISAIVQIFIIMRYYPIIGPSAWLLSTMFLTLLMLRTSRNMLIISALVLFCLAVFQDRFQYDFSNWKSLYPLHLMMLTVLFMTSVFVHINNNRKNSRIKEQLRLRFDDLNYMSDLNTTLEEEIQVHQETQAALFKSEKRYRTIVNALPDFVLHFDKTGVIIDCEAKDSSPFGIDISNYNGENIYNLLPAGYKEHFRKVFKDALSYDTVQTFEYSIFNDGKHFFYEMRLINAGDNQVISTVREITEAKEKQLYIEYLSYHDQLTGLYNRRFFDEETSRLDVERSIPISILVIDINGLKLVNDTFGHFTGDKLLITVANILTKECRSIDIIARMGGDEFAILLPNTGFDETDIIAKRMYTAINRERINEIIVSASIGFATKSNSTQSIKDVYEKAESNMYQKKLVESQSMRSRTINAILKTLNEKNIRERIHSERVSKISKNIGIALELDSEAVKELEIAGLMHDIGKISISENLLDKDGSLTNDEYEMIKSHPNSGYQILKSVDSYSSLADHILSHHERWDGAGYPRGLKGYEISLIARIISIADAFEAMTSDRAYRKGISDELAMQELRDFAGTQFDPDIVSIFDKNFDFVVDREIDG